MREARLVAQLRGLVQRLLQRNCLRKTRHTAASSQQLRRTLCVAEEAYKGGDVAGSEQQNSCRKEDRKQVEPRRHAGLAAGLRLRFDSGTWYPVPGHSSETDETAAV